MSKKNASRFVVGNNAVGEESKNYGEKRYHGVNSSYRETEYQQK